MKEKSKYAAKKARQFLEKAADDLGVYYTPPQGARDGGRGPVTANPPFAVRLGELSLALHKAADALTSAAGMARAVADGATGETLNLARGLEIGSLSHAQKIRAFARRAAALGASEGGAK